MLNDKQNYKETDTAKAFYASYEHHSNLLRTWFVAYGIGGPALFISNSALWTKLSPIPAGKCAIALFLISVGIQVLITLLNKSINYAIYYGEVSSTAKTTGWYKKADKISEKYWIDLAADIICALLMLVATILIFVGLASS